MTIECLVLGAGQEVGKSCVVVTTGGKRIMFDCGMHMGYQDRRRYPNFSLIPGSNDFDTAITCIIITHFHLDHIGALPYFTEVLGYQGPIYMTYPTKALAPLMLEDYRKVMVDRRGEKEQFTAQQIQGCMKKVTAVDLKQTVQVDKDLEIRAYYAGHVIGAAMFYAKVGSCTVVYTGDYNMTPDRHLGAAQIDRLYVDLLITESTYANSVRESKLARERDFLTAELCMLLDDFWERMNLKIPIYFSAGLTIQANMYYKILIGWTSQKVKDAYVTRNAFDFKNVCDFDRSQMTAPGPCVLFATPGMLSGGFSLEVFKQWAPSEMNLICLPGYCVYGTVGNKLMSKPKQIILDDKTHIDVRCQIHQLAFTAHTDSKGIMDLIKHVSPRQVVLVHGERPNMEILRERIKSELTIECHIPANHETVSVPSTQIVKVDMTKAFIKHNTSMMRRRVLDDIIEGNKTLTGLPSKVAEGIIVMEKGKRAKIVHQEELLPFLNTKEHEVHCSYCFPVYVGIQSGEVSMAKKSEGLSIERDSKGSSMQKDLDALSAERNLKAFMVEKDSRSLLERDLEALPAERNLASSSGTEVAIEIDQMSEKSEALFAERCLASLDRHPLLHLLFLKLKEWIGEVENIQELYGCIQLNSMCIHVCGNEDCPYRTEPAKEYDRALFFCCSWSWVDEKLARRVVSFMKDLDLSCD
ncbi:hypothetical protein AMTRI_Chr04g185090 [Amborella trichopoda]